jgi:hypothetical protein
MTDNSPTWGAAPPGKSEAMGRDFGFKGAILIDKSFQRNDT